MPFVVRYRRHATGGLDEHVVDAVFSAAAAFDALQKKKDAVLAKLKVLGAARRGGAFNMSLLLRPHRFDELLRPYRFDSLLRPDMFDEFGCGRGHTSSPASHTGVVALAAGPISTCEGRCVTRMIVLAALLPTE